MLNIKTEMQNYIRRQTALNAEKDITMIDGRNRTEIYSIGDDGNLYLCYEADGLKAEYSRKLVHSNVKEFAATNVAKTNKVAVACCDEKDVYLALTEHPENIEENDFIRLELDGVLNGKNLVPSDLLLSALDKGMTLFVEMKDDGGRIEQFSCLIDSDNPRNIKYFPLAANFSSVKCSVAGRAVGQYVDGIYTYGLYGETNQLLYTPSCNVFGSTPPAPIRFKSEYNIDSICTLSLKTKTGTHLFSVGEEKLYLYPYDRQKDMYHINNPDPDFLVSSELFREAKRIAAVRFDDTVYVYVLNEALVLSYTFAQCNGDKFGEFAEPVVLMDDVFYFDISDRGTMNICKNNSAVFGKRNSDSGEWGFKSATLETDLDEYTSNSAYVTRILTEKPFDEVLIEFPNGKVSCFVNDVCHNFQSMNVKADAMGAVTIVQIATTLTPPCMKVTYKDEVSQVNPAEEAQKRLLSLTDENTIKNQVIYDPDGKTRNLFGEGVDDTGLSLVASSISALSSSVNSIMPGFVPMPVKFANGVMVKIVDSLVDILPYDVTHNPFVDFVGKVVRDVAYAVSWVTDKIKWLYDHTIKKAVDFAIGLVGKVWKFVVKIGEKVLEVVVDTFEKVFSTAIKILEAIGIPISKIFDWLKKALGIDEACKMNDCMKKMLQLSAKKFAEMSEFAKEKVVDVLETAVDSVADWADVDVEKAKSFLKTRSDLSMNSLGFDCGPQGTYMFDTIFGMVSFESIQLPNFTPTQKMKDSMIVLEDTFRGLKNDIEASASIFLSMEQDLLDVFGSQDIAGICDALKKIIGKIGIAGIELCEALIKPLFDLIACMIEAVADYLCAPIHIPLLSEILKIFGIKEFSFVDLVTFPASFFATTVSRITRGTALFDDKMYSSIMNANSIENILGSLSEKKEFMNLQKKRQIYGTPIRGVSDLSEKKEFMNLQKKRQVYGTPIRGVSDDILEENLIAEEQDENEVPEARFLCPEDKKELVAGFKYAIASLGVIEIGVDVIVKALTIKKIKKRGAVGCALAALPILLPTIDFAMSLVTGDAYSPMDPDGDDGYVDELRIVKKFIEIYTYGWYIKSIVPWGNVAVYVSSRWYMVEDIEDVMEQWGKIFSGFQGLVCVGTFFVELGALISAFFVDKSKSERLKDEQSKKEYFYKDVDRDMSVFLSDDLAYVFDDVRTILDDLWELGLTNKIPGWGAVVYVAAREVFAAGYSGGMYTTAGLLTAKTKT